MLNKIAQTFLKLAPTTKECNYCSIRIINSNYEGISICRGVTMPIHLRKDSGYIVNVFHNGSFAYAASSDISSNGIEKTIKKALFWAKTGENHCIDYGGFQPEHNSGEYASPSIRPWDDMSQQAKIEYLTQAQNHFENTEHIVDWRIGLWHEFSESLLVTNGGGQISQIIQNTSPHLEVTANKGTITQTRGLGARGETRQAGLEILEDVRLEDRAKQFKAEVLQLLDAPNCPTGKMDLVLMPNQMMLQIHESIGHPLELDRILGDERNYAGTSFVDLEMFGKYQYGSPLLNVSFDPDVSGELASYKFDDDGRAAEKVMLIEDGILKQPLGGSYSIARAGILSGAANSRANNWNRPALDRMANLNLEAGNSSLEDIISNTEDGILMDTNCSWSIDDSRNKFQFGCELGRRIKNGEIKELVRNPNYRGISATFWRSLAQVGNKSTVEVLGTPFCGKAEPNQVIKVGHASPVCRFENIDVFGGE